MRETVLSSGRTELLEAGYATFSHRSVAQRAGVNPVTVYRRWPTRARLVADVLIAYADELAPVPDTGSLKGDLSQYAAMVAATVGDPALKRLWQAFSSAAIEGDEDVRQVLAGFWSVRFARTRIVFERAIDRCELRPDAPTDSVIEALISPIWFHGVVTQQPLSDELKERCLQTALTVLEKWHAPPS